MKIPVFQILALVISIYAAHSGMIEWITALLFWLTICTFSITINRKADYTEGIKELVSNRKGN